MIEQDLRDRLLAEPELLLEDRDVMAALIAANERAMGANIVDLRGIAMERLENRLDRLEDTHRSVIAAAYENLAGTNQVHRAILQMLDPLSFEDFLKTMASDVAQTLRVDCVRLVLETAQEAEDPALRKLGDALEGALLDCHWQEIPAERRSELVLAATDEVAKLPLPKGKRMPAAAPVKTVHLDGGEEGGMPEPDFGFDDPSSSRDD